MIPKKISAFFAKRSKREKMILLGTVTAILLVATDRFVVTPVTTSLAKTQQQITDEQTAVRNSLFLLLKKQDISAESREANRYVTAPNSPDEEMTGLLREIEAMAEQASLNLMYVKPASTREGEGGVKKYLANMECEAEMEQIVTFFYSIGSSSKLIKIEKYEIQPKSKESSVARCVITISKTVLS
jgi:Tfp pilus assembly protein PilO